MQPSAWSTSYNSTFRDRSKYFSPSGLTSSDNWASTTQAYYGTQASLSEHAARTAEAEARTQFGAKNYSGNTLALSGANSFSANGANGTNGSLAYGTGPITSRVNQPPKDLWSTDLVPHSGRYSDATTIRGGVDPNQPTTYVPDHANGLLTGRKGYFEHNQQFGSSSSSSSSSSSYDPTKPWDQYHIPGYSAHIRGAQFLHGDTFSKTSRLCLAVPNDTPLQP